jgi:protein ImuB
MRILCLSLQQTVEASCADIFLKFSPRVQFRYPHYVFIDIESTAVLFGGEFQTLKKAVDLARTMYPQATGAIADSAPVAQVMVNYKPFDIIPEGEEPKVLAKLPVTALLEMEGLEAWSKKTTVDKIVHFFQSIGMDWLEDIYHFPLASFRERWGEVGTVVWKRLQGQDFQLISPLLVQEPLMGYAYFDDPVAMIPVLMQKMEPQMRYLFLRLEGLSKYAQRMEILLFCEYSDHRHQVVIEPAAPSRDFQLFKDLFLKKIEKMDLQNPIREFEILIFDIPEKVQQLDFFAPRDNSEDRWRRLISFAHQADLEMGFLQPEASHLPETSYSFKSESPKEFSPKDLVEWADEAIQVKTVHAKALSDSPRPSLLLSEPLSITKTMLSKLKILTRFPTERIQSSWWKKMQERDYFFALSQDGQLMWVYQDCESEKYFLHGYFD